MPETLVTDRQSEDQKIHDWRVEQLETFGMPHDMAERYASRDDVDLNEFRGLLQKGYPPDLVARVSSLEVV